MNQNLQEPLINENKETYQLFSSIRSTINPLIRTNRPILHHVSVNTNKNLTHPSKLLLNTKLTTPLEYQLNLTKQILKAHATSYNLDYDSLLQESTEADGTLPSSRSMIEMKKLQYTWAEIYETEAWALPENSLLDKKFHWWRKVESIWKNSHLNESNTISASIKTNSENTDYNNKQKNNYNDKISNSTSKNKSDFFLEIERITKSSFQPINNYLDGLSALGNRRTAINQWIIDVSIVFNFNCSTYNLCMQVLDSYLEKKKKTQDPVNIESVTELMVVCVASLLLSAAMREHKSSLSSEGYLNMIIKNTKHSFTIQDIIIAQSDIINTIHPHLLASFIFFDYCLFFLAELRDRKFPFSHSIGLYEYIQKCGLLPWLLKLLYRGNKYIVNDCINLCVPGSRLAACFLLYVLSNFCGKDIFHNSNWFRNFTQHILHMHFDGDFSFWWILLLEKLQVIVKQIENSDSHAVSISSLWKIASENWRNSEKLLFSEASNTQKDKHIENWKTLTSKPRTKRDRDFIQFKETASPKKFQRHFYNKMTDLI